MLTSVSEHLLQYLGTVVFGGVVLLLYSIEEFPKRTFSPLPRWPENPFTLANLTTRRQYIESFVLYVAGLEFVFILICFIGPAPFVDLMAAFGESGEANNAASFEAFEAVESFPLWAALSLIGIVPRVPILQELERLWRRLMHERFLIPSAAVQIQRQMQRKRLDSSCLVYSDEYLKYIRKDNLTTDTGTTEYWWAKLSAVLRKLQTLVGVVEAADGEIDPSGLVDMEFIETHRNEIKAVEEEHRYIWEAATMIGDIPDDSKEHVFRKLLNSKKSQIETVFHKASMILACAIISKHPLPEQQNSVLQQFGFGDVDGQSSELNVGRDLDTILQGFFLGLGAFFALVFVAPFVKLDTVLTGWPDEVSTTFPFHWTGGALILHGVALITCFWLRRHLDRSNQWYRGQPLTATSPSFLNYLVVCGLSGTISAIAYSYYMAGIEGINYDNIPQQLSLYAPSALVSICTAFFVLRIVDVARISRARKKTLLRQLIWNAFLYVIAISASQTIASLHSEPANSISDGLIVLSVLSVACFAVIMSAMTVHGLIFGRQRQISHESSANPIGQL